jgi:hypothetical protein
MRYGGRIPGMKIAQPFRPGSAGIIGPSPGEAIESGVELEVLSSLSGLRRLSARWPSVKTLGYCHDAWIAC